MAKYQKRLQKKFVQIEKKQKDKTAKLRKKLQNSRIKRQELEDKNKGKLQTEINEVLHACIDRINLLQREDLDLYERRKLAIEFKEFVDKFVNPEYRENFYQFINHILHKYRMEAQKNMTGDGNLEKDDENVNTNVEWPVNCTHIKIAYTIWNSKKSQFSNPLEIAQRLRQCYYEETVNNEHDPDTDLTAQTYKTNYINSNNIDKNDVNLLAQLHPKDNVERQFGSQIFEAHRFNSDIRAGPKNEGGVDKAGELYGNKHFNSNHAF